MKPPRARLVVRNVFSAAWPLFQVCLPSCLPLAVVAVAIGGAGDGGIRSSASPGLPGSVAHWGALLLIAVLVLICHGAMLRQQLAMADGRRPILLRSLVAACLNAPYAFLIVAAWSLLFVPAMLRTAWHGFDAFAAGFTAVAAALAVYVLPAWPVMIAQRLNPWSALVKSIQAVRGRWLSLLGVFSTELAGLLVYALLAGIILGMVMNLAGQGISPTPEALALSRCLMAILLAIPLVHVGAVSVTASRCLS